MAHVADVLAYSEDENVLDYVAQFLAGVARSAEDTPLEKAAAALARARASGTSAASETASLAGLVQQRLARKLAI
jgi:hypothetical protein